MRHRAVHDDGGVHPALDGQGAGLDLGDHAAGYGAVLDALPCRAHRHLGDHLSRRVQYAVDIGQHQQPGGVDRRRQGAGEGIGVDVVGLALPPDADGGDDRDDVGFLEGGQDVGVDPVGFADEAEIENLLDVGIALAVGAAQLARLDQVGVLARQADRLAAGLVDRGDDLLVDRSREHHFDDFHRVAVGHPEAVDERALDLQAREHFADLRPAAVNDDGIDADLLEQHDIAGERPGQLGVAHGMAAVFDDEGLSGIAAHIGQRLGKGLRLGEPDVVGCAFAFHGGGLFYESKY